MKVKDNMKSLKEYLENLRRTYPISSTIGRINDIQEIKEFFLDIFPQNILMTSKMIT